MNRKRLSILGSTGSIGRNALKIVAMHPDRFDVTVLAGANNVNLLAEQIKIFKPEIAVVLNSERADMLRSVLSANSLPDCHKHDSSSYGSNEYDSTVHDLKYSNLHDVKILWGDSGYVLAASHENVDTVLLAMVGASGLMPALAAIDAGKHIALANKETLVMAGEIVMARAAEKGVTIYPVDSEHSAIFQCIEGNRTKDLKKIFLTASGGPFRTTPREKFKDIRPEDALNHPTWRMGSKITIDSATLMNKALEIVEAVRLFNIDVSDIEVLVHPQSIVHSMVGFNDGSVMAQMGMPDMKAAISYALSWPERLDLQLELPDFVALGSLCFEPPDKEKFPSLNFAVQACNEGGTLPAVMNAANEIAVNAFLNHQIDFPEIFIVIEKTMKMHKVIGRRDEKNMYENSSGEYETVPCETENQKTLSCETLTHETMIQEIIPHDNLTRKTITHDNITRKTITHDNITRKTITHDNITRKTMNHENLTRKTMTRKNLTYTLDDVIKADKWARETAILLIKKGI
ncbi:MAG: 1-deoxy-D-xylulose-5-phosphate reductoisomerase [Desulfamplus sp.]|nr:1-deoxy-D-xylulose-5-phosphate reductoisomerase [Desulfamplus sp.]